MGDVYPHDILSTITHDYCQRCHKVDPRPDEPCGGAEPSYAALKVRCDEVHAILSSKACDPQTDLGKMCKETLRQLTSCWESANKVAGVLMDERDALKARVAELERVNADLRDAIESAYHNGHAAGESQLRAKVEELERIGNNMHAQINYMIDGYKDALEQTGEHTPADVVQGMRAAASMLKERDQLRERVKQLVAFHDKHQGTPCEQIRHAQEVEALKERITTVEAENERLRKSLP